MYSSEAPAHESTEPPAVRTAGGCHGNVSCSATGTVSGLHGSAVCVAAGDTFAAKQNFRLGVSVDQATGAIPSLRLKGTEPMSVPLRRVATATVLLLAATAVASTAHAADIHAPLDRVTGRTLRLPAPAPEKFMTMNNLDEAQVRANEAVLVQTFAALNGLPISEPIGVL